MEEPDIKQNSLIKEKTELEEAGAEPSYPAVIENLSQKWRIMRRQEERSGQSSFYERHFLAFGILIGVLIVAFLTVIGGFAFLVWNAR